MRRPMAVVAVFAAVLSVSGCQFDGINSYPLPGTVGMGEDTYSVKVNLPDVGQLTQNAEVKVANVAVGTVTSLTAENYHAVATVSLLKDVRLPKNAAAKVGQNSVLGAAYLEMGPPPAEAPSGTLGDGDVIRLDRGGAYPSTEQVLAAASVVLNGGGLNQLETITSELNRALGGQDRAVATLIPRMETFVAGLDQQKTDIVEAIDGLNRFSGELAGQNEVLTNALDGISPALEVLNRQRTDLTQALVALGDFGDTAGNVVRASQGDLVANLRNLHPVLRSLADSGESLTNALNLAATFPFPAAGVPRACPGDYCNAFFIIDLTLSTLDTNFLSGTPGQGSLYGVEGVLGRSAGIAGEATDPLRTPSQPAPAVAPDVASPPSADAPGAPQLLAPILGAGR